MSSLALLEQMSNYSTEMVDAARANDWDRLTRLEKQVASLRDRIGVDNIMLEADYPHCDSTWPHTQATIHEEIGSLPADAIRKITWENACKFFSWDPFARTARQDATVKALRAKGADVREESAARAAGRQVERLFSLAERHQLRQHGRTVQAFNLTLTDLQRKVLALLGVDEAQVHVQRCGSLGRAGLLVARGVGDGASARLLAAAR